MTLIISGNKCPTMVVQIQNFRKFMSHTFRDIVRYFSTVASEDPVCICKDEHQHRRNNILIFMNSLQNIKITIKKTILIKSVCNAIATAIFPPLQLSLHQSNNSLMRKLFVTGSNYCSNHARQDEQRVKTTSQNYHRIRVRCD